MGHPHQLLASFSLAQLVVVALGKPEVASSTPGGSDLPVVVNSGQIPLTELARPRPLHTRYTRKTQAMLACTDHPRLRGSSMGVCEALCDMLACKKGYTNTF